MSLKAKLLWNDYLENKTKGKLLRNPSAVVEKVLPELTDTEIWWGNSKRGVWLRGFKTSAGPYSKNYLHLYALAPIRTKADLEKTLSICDKQTFRTKAVGEHKTILTCCPSNFWNSESKYCETSSKVFKVIVPISDLPRLISEGKIRRNSKNLGSLKVEHYLLGRKTSNKKLPKKKKH